MAFYTHCASCGAKVEAWDKDLSHAHYCGNCTPSHPITDLLDPGANWCPVCGEPYGVCQCTESQLNEAGNRAAYEILYGNEEREIQRKREEEYEAWWLASEDDED